jgi:two-component system, OmpR family, sensor histidine kinase KdpD
MLDEYKPSPDELLTLLKQEEENSRRGSLKIFFGMCAGVGKTFSMLQSAQADKTKGIDVVIGYIETHNRIETDNLAAGLESVPRKSIDYKGTFLSEPDIDAIIARKPKIVLVDELAHTNAPGCRHLKRYQDVMEILDNGIDVYTTVNVQHIESRSDTVAQITGVLVRETLPDEIFEKADEVELVDITPDELLQRFSEGKIYAPERSREAIQNFFRKGNITALREMALRIVADRVDKQVRQYMTQKRIPGPWKSGLRLMAVIGPSPHSAKLLRWAKNLSYTMGASLLALYVESPSKLNKQQKEQLTKNINLAKQLGAGFMTTSNTDVVKAILNIAHKENITHIFVGKPRHRSLLPMFMLGNFVSKLIRYSGNIDVYVLGSDVSSDDKYLRYISIPSFSSGISQYFLAIFITLSVTLMCYMIKGFIVYQVASFALLFTVSILAIFMGIGPILLSATLSALFWDYFFIPPAFTLHVQRPEDVMMLVMFFIIALLNGILTSRVRRQERMSRVREERTNALYHITQDLSLASGFDDILKIAVSGIKKYGKLDCAFFLQKGNSNLKEVPENETILKFNNNDFSVANWTFIHTKKAGKYTDTLPSSTYTFYPLSGSKMKIGVLAIDNLRELSGEDENFLDTIRAQVSNALEREFLNDIARQASVLDESDKLYKTLFNSISHELRIPVAAIMGASDSLLSTNYDKNLTGSLCSEIYTAAERLNRLIENLLNMSRLETGRITPHVDWNDIHDLINKVISNLKDELKPYNLDVVISPDMPLVKIDFGLMEQVLHNLVYNATQYSTPGTTIRIKAYYDASSFVLQVMDRGCGFPPDAIPYVCNKFYRVDGSKTGGTGLGLSIVKGFVEAHNGTISIENRQNGGARITLKIPSPLPDLKNL